MIAQESVSRIGNTAQWHWLFKVGSLAALINVAIIPTQIIVYMISPPPTLVIDWFNLLHNSALLGLLNLDLLYLLNNLLLIPIYMALCIALKPTHESIAITALIIGLVGIAAYMPSNAAFEMLALSKQYANAATPAQQSILLAAGQALIVKNEGTAFLVYYILNAVALLLFAFAMLRSRIFGKRTPYVGIGAGLLMIVPSTFGTIGLIFAFVSLLPWAIFSILIARTLFQLSRNNQAETEIAVPANL